VKGSRLRKAARKRIIALSALGKAAPKRIVAVSALVGAAVLTWAVSFYAPGVAGKVTGLFREDPPPTPEFQIRVGPEFNGTWLYPSTRSDLGNPPTEFCDTNEYRSWLRTSKAVPAANSFAVILRSNTESTVIVEGMSVQVRDRQPPLDGILLECAIGGGEGPGPVGSATIDLDRPTPSIAYETPTGEPSKRLAFKLEKGVDQFLIINARSKRNHVSWDASLLLLVDGVRRPVPLQDPDTQGPFSTTPSESGTEAWAWGSGRWTRSH
jgi:hypothetical protein